MKTEGLTLVEAWQALLDDRCVTDRLCRSTYKRDGTELLVWESVDEYWDKANADYLAGACGPFSIVPDPSIPEPKSLSFEEAVERLTENNLLIEVENTKLLVFKADPRKLNWPMLDLAERRGWPITEANQ